MFHVLRWHQSQKKRCRRRVLRRYGLPGVRFFALTAAVAMISAAMAPTIPIGLPLGMLAFVAGTFFAATVIGIPLAVVLW